MSQALNSALLRPNGEDPVVDKFAAVVATWGARQQAQFLIALGYAIEKRRGKAGAADCLDCIGHSIIVEEMGLIATYGTDFIVAIAGIVGVDKHAEAK